MLMCSNIYMPSYGKPSIIVVIEWIYDAMEYTGFASLITSPQLIDAIAAGINYFYLYSGVILPLLVAYLLIGMAMAIPMPASVQLSRPDEEMESDHLGPLQLSIPTAANGHLMYMRT